MIVGFHSTYSRVLLVAIVDADSCPSATAAALYPVNVLPSSMSVPASRHNLAAVALHSTGQRSFVKAGQEAVQEAL